jgi:hypothetical protein
MTLDDIGKYALWIILFALALGGIYLFLKKLGIM